MAPLFHIYTENVPAADPALGNFARQDSATSQSPISKVAASPAEHANNLINQALGRESAGASVVESDSVLGESGRLYHGYKEGRYFLPNDAAEQDRLDLQHKVFNLLLDGWLALAPIATNPGYVLDIGTGTGIWAVEFAEQNPSSHVIGTDLSAIQPSPKVSNCTFLKDDAEEEWVFHLPHPERTEPCLSICEHRIMFDYVHLRLMVTCFNEPKTVMRNAFNNLTPGGWIEFQEATMETFQANHEFGGTAVQKWSNGCIRGAAQKGRDLLSVKKYKQWLEEIGFQDVTEKKIFVPLAPWPADPKLKRIGQYQLQNVLEGARGVWLLLRASGMAPEEIEQLIVNMKDEILNTSNHLYAYSYVIYGRKPLESE